MKTGYKTSVIGEIPEYWNVTKLGNLGSTYNGLSGKSKIDFGNGKPYIPYLNIFSNSRINLLNLEYVNILENENQNQVKYGDAFFTTSSETPEEVGMSSVLLDDIGEVYLNSFCFGFRFHDFNSILPHYARYLFRSENIRKEIVILAQGSTRFNLSKNSICERINIPLPPLLEQQKIAEILTTVDDKLENIESQIIQYSLLKKGLMQQLLTKGIGHSEFVDSALGMIPKAWEVKRLDSISVKITDGSHFSPIPTKDTGYYIATVKDMRAKDFNPNSIVEILKLDFENLIRNGCKPEKNDILFSKDGTIGKTFVFDGLQELVLLSSIAIIRLKNEIAYSEFVCQALKSFIFDNQLEGLKSGSALKRLVLGAINEIKIPLPPLPEQQKIANILTSVDNKVELLQNQKSEYINLKIGLMEQLLTGKLRVKA